MKTIYFLRHGQSQANLDHVYAGQMDVPLTALGHDQAKAAAQRALEIGIKQIYCSDLQRSLTTAQIVGKSVGLDPVSDPRLRELYLGALQGTPEAGFKKYFAMAAKEINAEDVESLAAVRARLRSFLEDLSGVEVSPVLLVGHNGSGAVLRSMLEEPPVDPATLKPVENGHIVKLVEL